MTIKAIYFDFGGVIVRTEDKTSRARLAAEFGMSYDEIDKFVFDSPTAKLAGIGQVSEIEHFREVTRRLHLPESEMPRIRAAFFAGDRVDMDIINLLRGLRKTHRTGLISNAWDGLREWIVARKLDDAFENITISAERGFAKPDARIYQYALAQLGVEPGESVFVDDMEKNIAASQALGMHGVLFKSSQQTIQAVQQLLEA